MDRRDLLVYFGSALVVGFSGCLGGDGDSPSDWEPVVPDTANAFPTFEGDVSDVSATDIDEEIQFGTWEDVERTFEEVRASESTATDINIPWNVRVLNAAGLPEVDVGVVEVESQSIVYQERHEIPSEEAVQFLFLEPGTHVVQVHIPESGHEHGVRQPPGSATGSHGSTTRILVNDEDRMESSNATLL